MEKSSFTRYGEIPETTFDAKVVRRGNSDVVIVSKVMDMMGLKKDDIVRVTIRKKESREDE